MIKFVIFLACAFVIVQGGIFDDIIEAIDTTLPEIIQKIKDKISNDNTILIQKIKENIEEHIQHAGEIGRKCADDQSLGIEFLEMLMLEDRSKICVEEAESKIKALRQKLEDLLISEHLTVYDEAVDTIAVAKQSAQEAGADMVECSDKVQEQVTMETDQILGAISSCISALDS